MRIAVCDDEKSQIESITALVREWSKAEKRVCEVKAFASAEAFMFEYSADGNYDILLLDVEMPGISGIEMAKRLRGEGCRAEIIFITSHFEFYGEGYEVDALHYLIKPVEAKKLYTVLTKASARLETEPPFVVFSCDGETVKLYERDILYIEASLHYIVIHAKNREYRLKETLSSFAEKLSDDFYQAHRSYYVSLKHIKRISRNELTLDSGETLPLSRGKYDDINYAFIEQN